MRGMEIGSIEGDAQVELKDGVSHTRECVVMDGLKPAPSDLDSHPLPPTQDDDLWLEATIEETESEWWL